MVAQNRASLLPLACLPKASALLHKSKTCNTYCCAVPLRGNCQKLCFAWCAALLHNGKKRHSNLLPRLACRAFGNRNGAVPPFLAKGRSCFAARSCCAPGVQQSCTTARNCTRREPANWPTKTIQPRVYFGAKQMFFCFDTKIRHVLILQRYSHNKAQKHRLACVTLVTRDNTQTNRRYIRIKGKMSVSI